MTLIGLIAYAVLTCCGYRAKDWATCKWFTVGKNWGGVSLGFVIITDDNPSVKTLDHEFGHSLQNAVFGILFPFIVAIPSATRYWKREFDAKKANSFLLMIQYGLKDKLQRLAHYIDLCLKIKNNFIRKRICLNENY